MREIQLYGTVGESFWGEECFTPTTVARALAGSSGPLLVRLNSGGGVAADGMAIYRLLRDYPGEVTVSVDGAAASAASLIAIAGDRVLMRTGSFLLIHDPAAGFTAGRGTAADHAATAAALEKIARGYAEVYAARSGMSAAAAREMMRAETVLTAAEALEAGFATEVVDDEALAAAAFDYRLYANVPPPALRGCDRFGQRPERVAAYAMIAGVRPAPQQQEAHMANDTTGPELSGQTEGDAAEAQSPAAPAAAPAPSMTAREMSRLVMQAQMAGVPATTVAEWVEQGVGAREAEDRIFAAYRAQSARSTPSAPRPAAVITRDERETQRAGMVEALAARMARRDPDDRSAPARQFMRLNLAEMAATCLGQREMPRSAQDRAEVLTMATHTTSDFPNVLGNAVNRTLLAAYAQLTPTFRAFAREVSFVDYRPHPMQRIGELALLEEIGQGAEMKYGTLGEQSETVMLKPYGKAFRFTRQMMINDDVGMFGQVVADQARVAARTEEKYFYEMMLSGANADGPTLATTTRQVFNTTDGTKSSGGTAIDGTNYAVARAALRKQKGIDGAPLNLTPAVLVCGPDREYQARQLLAPIQATQTSNVNPWSGSVEVVPTPAIVGNAWYLFASPADAPVFVYGSLEGQAGPRVRIDEPFGQQGMAFSVERDFGCGAIDFRGGFKNVGA